MALFDNFSQNSDDTIKKLQQELNRTRSELNTFYEITKAMRTTLKLEEIFYVILTAITSRQGLGFNRAVIFTIDYSTNRIRGKMGVGPASAEEANKIWTWIEGSRKNLYDLINEYHRIKQAENQPEFFRLVQSLEIPYNSQAGIIYKVIIENRNIYLSRDAAKTLPQEDFLIKTFNTQEAVLSPLWARNRIIGIIFADNFVTKRPITGADIKILEMFISQASLAIENSQEYENLLVKSHTDSLTGLWNHGYFQHKLNEKLIEISRHNNTLALIIMDIDDFKKYNDTFGHIEGDEALKKIANIIKETCRRQDIICRYGGEEFAVILPYTNKQDAVSIAQRLKEAINNTSAFRTKLTLSMGLSFFPENSKEKKELINIADIRLYKAKALGKNTIVCD